MYLFLAVLGLHWCVGFSLVARSRGYPLAAVYGLLIAVGSLFVTPSERLLLNHERCQDSWPLEENSIWGQRWGFITQTFCVIKFYSSIKGIEKASDIDIRRGQKDWPLANVSNGVIYIFNYLLQWIKRMEVVKTLLAAAAAAAKLLQLCPTLCGPMDCSLPGSSVHGIFQARILE